MKLRLPRRLCDWLGHPWATLMFDEEGFFVKDCSCRTVIFASFDPDHEWDPSDYARVLARYGLVDDTL